MADYSTLSDEEFMKLYNEKVGSPVKAEEPVQESKSKPIAEMSDEELDEAIAKAKGISGEPEYKTGLKDYLRGAGQGLSFGLADELEAGFLTGGGLWGDYNKEVGTIRDQLRRARESSPIGMGIAEVGGGLLTGGMGAAKVLGMKALGKGLPTLLGQGAKKAGNLIIRKPGAELASEIAEGSARIGSTAATQAGLYGAGTGEGMLGDRLKQGGLYAYEAATNPWTYALGGAGQTAGRIMGMMPGAKYTVTPGIYGQKDFVREELISNDKVIKKIMDNPASLYDPSRTKLLKPKWKPLTEHPYSGKKMSKKEAKEFVKNNPEFGEPEVRLTSDVLRNLGSVATGGLAPYVTTVGDR